MKRSIALASIAALVAGTMGAVQPASGAGTTALLGFIPIVPCRLMDTRVGSDNVGPRSTPLGPAETYTISVWGANGNCNIPTTALAMSFNITVTNGTVPSFLTIFPADAPLPVISQMNWVPGTAPTPNNVEVKLSATGTLSFYNLTGTVNVIADVMGYYEPAQASLPPVAPDTGIAGPQGPARAGRPAGPKALLVPKVTPAPPVLRARPAVLKASKVPKVTPVLPVPKVTPGPPVPRVTPERPELPAHKALPDHKARSGHKVRRAAVSARSRSSLRRSRSWPATSPTVAAPRRCVQLATSPSAVA